MLITACLTVLVAVVVVEFSDHLNTFFCADLVEHPVRRYLGLLWPGFRVFCDGEMGYH